MTLEERIEAIPEGGWWKSGSEEFFLEFAKELINRGFTEDEAIDWLQTAYWRVADCFGGG